MLCEELSPAALHFNIRMLRSYYALFATANVKGGLKYGIASANYIVSMVSNSGEANNSLVSSQWAYLC